ncbi:MAG: DUF2029 domain-containing protein [Fimbriiglobus sp.]|jgi:hypothetical protein|nr:DUF2029 domain-containing protein [Fimbriiglobus sp.]
MIRFLLPLVSGVVLLALVGVAGWYLSANPHVWPPDDYVEYWAAGRLNLTGGNPYSADELLPLERFAGRDTDEAIMMWNPPWTLTMAMPLGALPPRLGQVVWLVLSFAAVAASVWLLWTTYSAPAEKRWIGLAVAFTFVPTLFVLQSGQISAFLLLGCALFAWCARRGFHFAAGAAAVLVAVKPHLAYLLWLAVGLDAIVNRRWRIVLGGVVMGVAATVIPMVLNPEVWGQYIEAYRSSPVPPSKWVSLTLGVVLRLAWGTDHFWLQFLPMLVALAGFGLHWKKHGKEWDWAEQLPSLVACSFVTAPYGAWHFDLVLMLLPILHRAAGLVGRRWFWPLVLLATVNITMLAMTRFQLWSFWYCWVAPLVLVGYAFTSPRRSAALVPA